MRITKKQIQDWEDYEQVRKSGEFNMLFPGAREATGLTREEYTFVMKNYNELKTAARSKTK